MTVGRSKSQRKIAPNCSNSNNLKTHCHKNNKWLNQYTETSKVNTSTP